MCQECLEDQVLDLFRPAVKDRLVAVLREPDPIAAMQHLAFRLIGFTGQRRSGQGGLGRQEAGDYRRLKSGLAGVPATFHRVLAVQEEVWAGDHLQFRVSALGQVASGTIDVADDHRLDVALPWLLAQLVEKMQPVIRNQGKVMLEKK
jgi:hypothetical protein